MSLFAELKRRNVFRVAIAYVVIAWLILQVGETLAPALRLPDTVNSVLAFFLLLGFPMVVFFAWAFEITPEGLKREKDVDRDKSITQATGKKLDRITIVLLILAVGYFFWESRFKAELEPTPGSEIGQTREVRDGDADASPDAETSDAHSIAVLPFVNMSSDEEQEYFSDGLSEELLNLLTKIPELRVTSRSSAFSYKGKVFKISDVGRELNVDHVLEGSVRKSGNIVRITAQLIDVSEDVHLWSETWDRTLDDIFEIQDEIASAVVEALKIRLLGEAPRSIKTVPEAYSLYLQARHFMSQRSVVGYERAESIIKEALAIDPNYSPAWVRLGLIYIDGAQIGNWSPDEAFPLAREAVAKALQLDSNIGGAHAVMSEIAIRYDLDIEAASRHMRQALSLDPGNAGVIDQAATLSLFTGDFDEFIRLQSEASKRDPFFTQYYIGLGYGYLYVGRTDDAIDTFRKVIELSPGSSGLHYYLGCALLVSGDTDGALAAMNEETLDGFQLTGRALVYHALGNRTLSDVELNQLIDIWGDVGAYQISSIYAYRGEIDKAFEWLNRAVDYRDTGLALIHGDPFLDNLRDDPRFDELIQRMGLKPPG